MASNREILGWTDPSEWEYVYNNIFSGNKQKIKHGLDVINIWKCKYSGRMPVAIEATAQVLECLNEHCSESELSRRQRMSTAVSQFVGLLTERALKGQIHSIPMRQRGEKFGIPEWMTSLRHDIAHAQLPVLQQLEEGVYFALKWLKINHWDQHLDWICSKREEPVKETEDNITEVETLLNFIFANSKKTSESQPFPRSEIAPLVETLVQYNMTSIPTYISGNMRHDKRASCNSVMKRFRRVLELLRDSNQLDALLTEIHNQSKYPYMSKATVDILVKLISEISEGTCADPFAATATPTEMDVSHKESHKPIATGNINTPAESRTLCDYDLSDCCLGLMPGQKKETLWQALHGKIFSNEDQVEISCRSEERMVKPDINPYLCDFDLL